MITRKFESAARARFIFLFSKAKKLIPLFLRRYLGNRKNKITGFLLNILESVTGRYFTFHIRPMCASDVFTDPKEIHYDYSRYAIVIQGPINKKHDFTLETMRLYKKYFPNALIVLSTWEGEDAYTINCAKDIGVEVILNKKPAVAGFNNVNLQMTSSMAGLNFAAKMNKEYALKTRTDQRIYNSNSLLFLSNLLRNFPITASGSKQKGRLIGIGAYNYNTRPKLYHLYDNFIFGYVKDVSMYFGAYFISNEAPVLTFLKDLYPHRPFTAEGYFFTEFLKKNGHKLKYTPEDYLQSLARYCILVDARSLGWYWYKYRRFFEYQNLNLTYKDSGNFSFVEWLNIYYSYGVAK